jgi:hypothetical protein
MAKSPRQLDYETPREEASDGHFRRITWTLVGILLAGALIVLLLFIGTGVRH